MFVLRYLVERTENLFQFIGSDAYTVILNRYGEISYFVILISIQLGGYKNAQFGKRFYVHLYQYGAAVRHILESVGEEVEIHFLQHIPVEPQRLPVNGMLEFQMDVPI